MTALLRKKDESRSSQAACPQGRSSSPLFVREQYCRLAEGSAELQLHCPSCISLSLFQRPMVKGQPFSTHLFCAALDCNRNTSNTGRLVATGANGKQTTHCAAALGNPPNIPPFLLDGRLGSNTQVNNSTTATGVCREDMQKRQSC